MFSNDLLLHRSEGFEAFPESCHLTFREVLPIRRKISQGLCLERLQLIHEKRDTPPFDVHPKS